RLYSGAPRVADGPGGDPAPGAQRGPRRSRPRLRAGARRVWGHPDAGRQHPGQDDDRPPGHLQRRADGRGAGGDRAGPGSHRAVLPGPPRRGATGRALGVMGQVDLALTKRFPGFTLDVAWTAGGGGGVLCGPSGAGKSVPLRGLAGRERPEGARIAITGRTFFDAATGGTLPPQARRLGYVFQGYALFPHLTV